MILRPYQERAVAEVATKLFDGKRKCVFQLATGGGKCLGRDTPIIMYNGEVKKVQDIKAGELLMGPDSKPRKVLSTCKGSEMLYEVLPIKGDPYTVNESHILSLKTTGDRTITDNNGNRYRGKHIINISVRDYIQCNNTFKHCTKGYRSEAVQFSNTEKLLISPYILGIWLGDGISKNIGFANTDKEIISAIYDYAESLNCKVREEFSEGKCPNFYITGGASNGRSGGSNPALNAFKHYDLINNKHIPIEYFRSSKKDRLKLLAGILDADGHGTKAGYDVIFKSERLADDFCFLSRSLGFAVYKKQCKKICLNNGVEGKYFRMYLTGNCSEIPLKIESKKVKIREQKKHHLVTGISLTPVGIGDYYGFEIDGDRRFLLGDFTVTHNTIVFSAISDRYITKSKRAVLILVHRKELLQQTRRTLYNAFGISAQIVIAGMKHVPPADVYVGMIESVKRRIKLLQNIGLVIIDEAHIDSFNKIHDHFPAEYIIGFTATPLAANKRRPMKMFYEDIVCGVDIPELIEQNFLCQNITFAPRDTVDRAALSVKGNDFDDGLMAAQFSAPKYVNNTVKAYERWAKGTKTIIFNVNIDHSIQVDNAFKLAGYNSRHLDSNMTATERTNTLNWFKHTPDAILNNVGIATTGFDEPTIENVIINKATMSMPLWLQMTGRGGRPTESKSAFTIIDMGGNAISHGDWCDSRDWENIFHNPPKTKDKEGVAPVKYCPECDAIIASQCRTCKHCGYEFPTKDQEMENELGDFVVVTKGIDVRGIIEAHKEKKEYYPFFKIGKDLAIAAKQSVPKLTDDIVEFILNNYYIKAQEWCNMKGKRFNQWHKERARETLYNELSERFKKWDNPLERATTQPSDAYTPPKIKPITSLKAIG